MTLQDEIKSAKKKKNGMSKVEDGEAGGNKKKGGTPKKIEHEQLEAWAKEDADALQLLVSLIPKQHYAQPSENSQVATKYMKKPTDTVSQKALRAERNAKKRAKFDTEKDEDDSGDEDDDDEKESDSEKQPESKSARQKPGKGDEGDGKNATSFSEERVSNVGELRERLKRKLESLRGNRPEAKEDGERSSKAQKRAEKKEKKKKTKEKQKQKESSVPIPSPMPKQDAKPKASSAGKGDGSFSFGRIKMGGEDVIGGGKNKDKKYREKPEVLLRKIEEKKKKLEEVGADTEEGKKMKERQQWGAVIDRAQGVKVKDDASLLQKTIKKKEKAKAKASEKWLKRAKDIEESRSKKAKERNDNVKARILERRNKKIGIKKTKTKKDGPAANKGGKKKPGF